MLRTFLLLSPVICLVACANARPQVIAQTPKVPAVLSVAPLDVRFAKVHFNRLPIQDAIDLLAAEVRRIYGSKYFFSPAFQSATDPMMTAPLPNPRVSFHGTDVSARDVFSAICQQVGWSYEWNEKHNIMFTIG